MRKLLDAARAERHRRVAGEEGGPSYVIAGHPMSVEDLKELLREIDGCSRGLPGAEGPADLDRAAASKAADRE
jgi:hypothetical protein